MPRGNPNIGKSGIGKSSRFSGRTAADAARKSQAKQKAMRPIKLCMKGIATEVAYGKPPLGEAVLKPVADFFGIEVSEVTFMHLAFFRLGTEMSKGDQQALDRMANYIGEKPSDKLEVVSTDYSALDAAFEAEA